MKNFGAQNMVSSIKKVLMKKPQTFMSKVDTQKWNYIAPLDQYLINENYNDFYKIIKNSGAEIVELGLDDENEEFEIPPWLGEEVTADYRYLNSNLAKNPFSSW